MLVWFSKTKYHVIYVTSDAIGLSGWETSQVKNRKRKKIRANSVSF